jgi:hypothetical protein
MGSVRRNIYTFCAARDRFQVPTPLGCTMGVGMRLL